jgi:hypothetical protein
MLEKPKTPPMEIQSGSSGWRHMPSPMASFTSAKPEVELTPILAELRQARAETARREALRKQRSRLAETLHQKG